MWKHGAGTIVDEAGDPVVGTRVQALQGVRPAADGAYLVRNLPAGNYLLAPVDDVEPGEWFDPGFLQRLVPVAVRITIEDGEQKAQDVRIGGWFFARKPNRAYIRLLPQADDVRGTDPQFDRLRPPPDHLMSSAT